MAALLSALAAVFAASVAWIVHRGQLYELGRQLHRDLTTGETEAARHILGGRIRGVRNEKDLTEAVRAYYRLLWSFERVHVGRRRITRARIAGCMPLGGSPLDHLDELAGGHVREWARRLELLHRKLSDDLAADGHPPIDHDDALPRLLSLVEAMQHRRTRIDRRHARLAKLRLAKR